jgi:hypothetical protein
MARKAVNPTCLVCDPEPWNITYKWKTCGWETGPDGKVKYFIRDMDSELDALMDERIKEAQQLFFKKLGDGNLGN